MPNIRATGIHTGEGIFDTSVSVFAYGKNSYFTLTNSVNHSLDLHYVRSDGARVFHIDGHSMAADFGGKVGIGKILPQAALHIGQSNQEIRFEYNGTDAYYGSLRWAGLQLGNNGPNRLIAGRTAAGGSLEFWVNNTNDAANYQQSPDGTLAMRLAASGNVGIGTTTPDHKLDVDGTIRAKEVIVESGWSDFVFEPGYRLRPLSEVESHIAERGHLPDVPSATDVEGEGLSVGATQRIMMQKIEELTLYAIEQNKRIEAQQAEIDALKARSKL